MWRVCLVVLKIQGKTICHYFHFEMGFESGNLHVCGYETIEGAGILTLMGIADHFQNQTREMIPGLLIVIVQTLVLLPCLL